MGTPHILDVCFPCIIKTSHGPSCIYNDLYLQTELPGWLVPKLCPTLMWALFFFSFSFLQASLYVHQFSLSCGHLYAGTTLWVFLFLYGQAYTSTGAIKSLQTYEQGKIIPTTRTIYQRETGLSMSRAPTILPKCWFTWRFWFSLSLGTGELIGGLWWRSLHQHCW